MASIKVDGEASKGAAHEREANRVRAEFGCIPERSTRLGTGTPLQLMVTMLCVRFGRVDVFRITQPQKAFGAYGHWHRITNIGAPGARKWCMVACVDGGTASSLRA